MRRTTLMAALLIAVWLTSGAQAQNNKKTGDAVSPVVWVDSARLVNEFRKTEAFSKLQMDANRQADALQKEGDRLTQTRYLNPQELAEYNELKTKPRPNKEEQERITQLEQRSDQLDAELQSLSVITSPSPQERERLRELNVMRQSAETRLRGEYARLDGEMEKIDSQIRSDVSEKVIEAIEKTARAMKWESVLDVRAVLFGGLDATDEVIKRLAK